MNGRSVWIASTVLGLLTALSGPARADWFQIEVVVFAQSTATGTEAWDPAPILAYPPDVQALRYGPPLRDLPSDETPELRTIEILWGPPRHAALSEHFQQLEGELFLRDALEAWLGPDDLQPQEAPQDSAEEAFEAAPATAPDVPAALPVLPVERAYTALPPDQRQLRSEAQRLERSGRYRLLWHEAWRQYLPDNGRSRPLLVRGGALLPDGLQHELQGSLRVYRSRFLHVETDLWLLRPTSPALASLTRPPAAPTGLDPAIAEQMQGVFANGVLADDATLRWPPDLGANDASMPLSAVEIHTLREQRRARSEELHYLDHPRLGALVLIRPYRFAPWRPRDSAQ